MKLALPRGLRTAAGIVGAVTLVAGLVVQADTRNIAPQVRLHSGAAWVASGAAGQLTLLDGPSAEVAAQVQIDQPGSVLTAIQDGTTGYVLNRTRDSLFRVDGATRERSQPVPTVAGAGASLAVFPTPDAIHTFDTQTGQFSSADPKTLQPKGETTQLAVRAAPDESVMDADGKLWVLDEQTGDLVWLDGGTRHSRARAHTPGSAHLALTGDRPAILDSARRTAELLGTDGTVGKSIPVDLTPGETVAVSGSAAESRLLVSDSARGQLTVCAFDAGNCTPIPLSGPGDLGRAVEIGTRAVVPDYATGKAFIVDLAQRRLLAERQLFNHPVRFELLSRDGMVFYNDPLSDQAGVLSAEGGVRPISKYNPAKPQDGVAPVPGTGAPGPAQPGPDTTSAVTIEISPRNHGMAGDEFQLTALGTGALGITSGQWSFGDGGTATGTVVKHRWAGPGTYPVSVSAQLSSGQTARAAAQVVIDSPDAPPRIVKLIVTPETPYAGQNTKLGVELAGGRYTGLAWSVTGPGGEVASATTAEFSHVFTAAGTYTAKLVVTGGATRVEQSREFTVLPAPRTVECGDKITENAVLSGDLTCYGSVGLTVAASNVTLDLAGHTVSTNSTSAVRKAIVVSGVSNVTIRNGTISQFADGIVISDAADVTVDHVTVVSQKQENFNHFAIASERAKNLQIRNSSLDVMNLFRFDKGTSATVTGSAMNGSLSQGAHAYCAGESSCVIRDGQLKTMNLACDEKTSSVTVDRVRVFVNQFGAGCRVATLTNSQVEQFVYPSAENNVMTGNIFDGANIVIVGMPSEVSGNVFRNARFEALLITDTARGTVSGNRFLNAKGSGIKVEFGWDGGTGAVEISGNEFVGNGFGTDPDNHGVDGLTVGEIKDGLVTVVIKNNHAKNNAQFGIRASPGTVIDGGGNTTSGDPKGCQGVVCTQGS